MTAQDIRLEVLKLLRLPDIANPDLTQYLARAKALEAYVIGEGQAASPPQSTETPKPQLQARTNPQSSAPARK